MELTKIKTETDIYFELFMSHIKNKIYGISDLSLALPDGQIYLAKIRKEDDELIFRLDEHDYSSEDMYYFFDKVCRNYVRSTFTLGSHTLQKHFQHNKNFVEYWCFFIFYDDKTSEWKLLEMTASAIKKTHETLIEKNMSDIDLDIVVYRDSVDTILGMDMK